MTIERQKEILQAMINSISDSPIGAEVLLGYVDSDDIHQEWQEFKEEVSIE